MVFVGCDSSVGIVTHYELDGPGIKSRWRRDTPLLTSPGAQPAYCAMGIGSVSQGVEWPRHGINHLPPSCTKVTKEQLHTSTPPLGLLDCSRENFIPLPSKWS